MNAQLENVDMDQWLSSKLDELLPTRLQAIEDARTPSMAIIAPRGRWTGTLQYSSPFKLLPLCSMLRPAMSQAATQSHQEPDTSSPLQPRLPAPGARLLWSRLYGDSLPLVLASAAQAHDGIL
ncbi:MAG: hypothetical protein U9P00_02060, partial [Pseudomonadota bacterium]|nr:hypothetical protein [Pseudomonadota bacterium]